MTSPYPRTYYKDYSSEEDEKLAEELFYGTMVRDKKTGRDCHEYLPEGSPQERQAFDALQRLLTFSDLPSGVLAGLVCSLDPGGSFGRRLVFKRRKRKRPVGAATDLQIFFYVQSLERAGLKIESAIQYAMDNFDLSRNAVFEARARIRRENPEFKA
jgi:hypothetical protein